MSRKLFRALILCALIVSALASATSASATNWTSNGPLSYTAISPTATKLTAATPAGPSLICSTASISGNVSGPVGPVNTGPWNGVATSKPAFSGCTFGGITATVVCTPITLAQFNALSQSGGPGTTVSGTFTSINCSVTVSGCTFQLHGSVNVTYNNLGQFTIIVAGQGLIVTWPNTPACNAMFGSVGGGTAPGTLTGVSGSPVSYAISGGPIPIINRN